MSLFFRRLIRDMNLNLVPFGGHVLVFITVKFRLVFHVTLFDIVISCRFVFLFLTQNSPCFQILIFMIIIIKKPSMSIDDTGVSSI